MSNVKDRREVARLTVRGREFRIERIVWKDSTGLSFDVHDVATGQCLTAESFDNQPREAEVDTLLDQLKDDLEGGTLDGFFDDDETKATLAEILAPDLRLTRGGAAVTFDRKAFRAWCLAPHSSGVGTNRANLLSGEYDSVRGEASALAENALSYVVDVPQVWACGDGVTDVTIYRTTDNEGADGGGAVVFTIDGIEMSAGHLQAGDLVPRESASIVGASYLALNAIAAAVNRAAARFRVATSRPEAAPAEQVPQLRGSEVWGRVTLDFDGQGGDTWRAVYDPSRRWKGFLCPHFRRDEAELMRLYFDAAAAREPDAMVDTLRWDGDVLVLVSGQYNRDGGSLEPGGEPAEDRIEPDERGLYRIGGYTWIWNPAAGDAAASVEPEGQRESTAAGA